LPLFIINMVVEEVVNTSGDILIRLGQIGLWIQALGLAIVIWIIFHIISLIITGKRIKEVHQIKEDMKRMENKLDRLLKKR
jgi:biopolymer transport protein ExbB/TolQ